MKIGIWNGSQTSDGGRLLYRVLVDDALQAGLRGATVFTGVEGGRSNRVFRTIENEVASNELPMWIELVDDADKAAAWLPVALRKLQHHGILAVQTLAACSQGDGVSQMNGQGAHPEETRWTKDLLLSEGLQLQVHTVENARADGKPVYQAVAEVLREYGIVWIATFRGVCGFGARRRLNRPRLFQPAAVPVVVTALDTVDKVERVLPRLCEVLQGDGLITVTRVYYSRPPR